jgi:stage III sporulation protein SpoIIIAA
VNAVNSSLYREHSIFLCWYAAGDADLPHKALGAARRVAVPQRLQQGAAMLQAARNNCVDVMVVDELATAEVGASHVALLICLLDGSW